MVKELNNMKNKKSNSYKPYDSSNSFVRRVTTRVSQLLPQPTSWLSRFLNRSPEQTGPFKSQDEEEEEISQPPPSKRVRTVQTCTDFPLYHNSVGKSADFQRLEERKDEVLSPIRSYKFPSVAGPSSSQDLEAPGPSGLSRHRFVASTPAVHPDPQIEPKLNDDDGSDSDSVSQASSLPAEPNEQPRSLFRSLNKPRSSHRQTTIADVRNNSLLKSKQLKLDLSTSSLSSSRGRVSFDTTIFNSPFKGRLCGGLSVSRDETTESPFYRSNTTFGGASSCNDSLLRTRSLHSEVPIVIQPSQPHRVSDNLGSSTKKILKALEEFSTPMLDQSRRVQLRDRGLKRKVEVPYKELVIPQMPDLLRIKRREAKHARLSASVSSYDGMPNSASKNVASLAEVVASQSSSSQLSQRLSKTDDSCKDKVEILPDKKTEGVKKIKEPPSIMPSLPIATLPKFDTSLVKHTQASVSSPSIAVKPSCQFIFSKPITVCRDSDDVSPIPPSKQFSRPLDPDSKINENKEKVTINCVNSASKKELEEMTYDPPSATKLKRKVAVNTESKPADSSCSDLKTGSVLDILNKYVVPVAPDIKSGSIADVLKKSQETVKKSAAGPKWECQGCYVTNEESKTKCVACDQPKKPIEDKSKAKGFGDKFKMTSNEWECSSCLVRNNIKESACVACGQSNAEAKTVNSVSNPHRPTNQSFAGFGDKFKRPVGSWECTVCLVQNKAADTKCVSCSSAKPGAAPSKPIQTSASPLSNLFKKPEGSWECDTCLVRNSGDVISCVSCGTTKPGAKPSKPAQTFSFGIPPTSDGSPKFSFGVSSTSLMDAAAKPTFTSSSASSQPVKPVFTFGIPISQSDNKSASPSIFSGVKSISGIDNESNSESTETGGEKNVSHPPKSRSNEMKLDSESVQTFVPVPAVKKDTGTAALETSSKSIFGNVTTSSPSTLVTTTSVSSSSVSPSSLPIFVNQISSTKCPVASTEKITPPASTPVFTFGAAASSSLSQVESTPAISEAAKPPDSSIPIFSSVDNRPMATSPVNKVNIFSLNNSENNTSEVKPNMFTFGSSGTSDKKTFLNSKDGAFIANPVNSFGSQSSCAPVKPVFSFTGGFSSGSTTNQLKTDNGADSFGSQQLQQKISAGAKTLKHKEPVPVRFQAKSEPVSNPFQFSNETATTNHTNNLSNPTTGTNQFNSNFTNIANSPFSTQGSIFGSPAPQPAPTASFLFGASQANDRPPPAPSFSFAAQGGGSTVNSVGNTSVAGGFAFGQTQNSAPVQPPSFDPNIKPVFNFSGGQTPTFSATPSTDLPERKIRKAVRRTTQK